MHENQSLPPRVKQRVLALHRYAIALKQGDLDGVAAVLHEAEQDSALGKMIQEFNTTAQEEEHLTVPPPHLSLVQELLSPHSSAQPPGEKLLAGESLPTGMAAVLPREEKQATRSEAGEHRVGVTRRKQQFASFTQAVAAVVIVVFLLGGFLVLFASHPHQSERGNRQAQGSQKEILVLAGADGVVSALRASDHTILWQQQIGKEISILTMWQQIVYVVPFISGHMDIYALNARNGAVIWHHPLTNEVNLPQGLAVDDGLVILSDAYGIYALDARTGREVQHYPGYPRATSGEWVITVHNGIIYAADTDKDNQTSLVAFRARDKKLLWRHEFPSNVAPEAVSIANNIVYVHAGASPSYLAALSNENGSALWLRKLSLSGVTLSLFTAEGDTIYFYIDHYFCAYRAHDGTLIYCRLASQPPDEQIGANGSFYTAFVVECPPYDPHKECQPRDPRDRYKYEIEARDASSIQGVRWHWSSALTTIGSRMFLSVVDDQLYVTTGEGIYALRVRDGFQQWYVKAPHIVGFTVGSLLD